jgi:hypothetical protein
MWEASTKSFLGHEHSHYIIMIRIRRMERAERLGCYEVRKVWEVRKGSRWERLGRSEILGSYGERIFLEVR